MANHDFNQKIILNMKKLMAILMAGFLGLLMTTSLSAQCSSSKTVVGGAEINPNKDIVSNIAQSKQHTTLVAAVKAANLVSTLQSEGPFTVFAPVNDAFENLPEGTVETLLRPENIDMLTKILTYHVVAGKLDATSITNAIKKGNGSATLTTVSGDKLTAMMNGDRNVILKDESGNYANVTIYDAFQSNGVVHVLDSVILPN